MTETELLTALRNVAGQCATGEDTYGSMLTRAAADRIAELSAALRAAEKRETKLRERLRWHAEFFQERRVLALELNDEADAKMFAALQRGTEAALASEETPNAK